jgi:hypothetical protein
MEMKKAPIACCHTVFTKEQRVAYKRTWEELEARRRGITELANGYRHEFPGDPQTLRLVHEWIGMERQCCPFLTFTVIVGNEEEPILLQLTGSEEVKAFLQTDLQSEIERISRVQDS